VLDEAAQTVTGPAAALSVVSLLCDKRAESGLYGGWQGCIVATESTKPAALAILRPFFRQCARRLF